MGKLNKQSKIVIGLALIAIALGGGILGGIWLGNILGYSDQHNRGAGPTNEAGIDISPGQFTQRRDDVSMLINVIATIYGESHRIEEIHYEDVMLCLYDRNGTVLHGENLGTISMRNRTEFAERYVINVTVSKIPIYFLIDHPDLRNGSVVSTDLLEWVPDRDTYTPRQEGLGEIQNEFEFPRSHERGVCG